MFDRWLMRATMWARNPPPAKKVRFVIVIMAICVAIYWFERLFGWPDWLTVERIRRP